MSVMIADRFDLPLAEESPQEEDHDLQMGHSTKISHAHYALGSNYVAGMGRGDALKFLNTSRRWQQIFRFDPEKAVGHNEVGESEIIKAPLILKYPAPGLGLG